MIFQWFKIFNKVEFEATELVSRTVTLILTGRGQASFLITKGNEFGLTYGGTFLPINFTGSNPYARDGYAIYHDPVTDDVYWGFEVPDA